jgi:hypothetical protein
VTLSYTVNCIVKKGRADLIVPMCPLLKLMQLVYRYKQSLAEIDLIAFSGIFLFDHEAAGGIEKLSLEAKEAVLHTVFFAINWFREVRRRLSRSSPRMSYLLRHAFIPLARPPLF